MDDAPPPASDPLPFPVTPVHSLRSPQTVIALYGLTIAGFIIGGVFWKGDLQLITAIANSVLGMIVGGVFGFYFGSSSGSQSKDAAGPANLPPPPPLP